MVADPTRLRYYVDESALGIGKTLAIARKDVVHVGHVLIPECPLGVLDVDWIPAVAQRGLAVIARDRRIRSRPAELALLRAGGLRVFWIAGKRDMATWDWLVRLVRHWDTLDRIVADRPDGPWFYAINDNAVVEIEV